MQASNTTVGVAESNDNWLPDLWLSCLKAYWLETGISCCPNTCIKYETKRSQFCVKLCNSWSNWSTTVEPLSDANPESGRKSKIEFTVARVHVESVQRKPSMADLSPAWSVQPDFVKLDYPWSRNSSDNTTPPLIPHIIHQVCYATRKFC